MSSLSCLLSNKDASKSSRKYQCQNGKIEKNILKYCFLQGITFSGVLPQEKEYDILWCNNSMKITDPNVCMNCFKNKVF